MTENATARASGETSDTIPVSSAGRRGWQRSIILVAGEETAFDPKATGTSVIVLGGCAAANLRDALGTWRGEYAGLEIG